MIAGGYVAALCFVICGFLQIKINSTLPEIPAQDTAFLSVVNGFPAGCNVTISGVPGSESRTLSHNSSLYDTRSDDANAVLRVPVGRELRIEPVLTFSGSCAGHHEAIYPIQLQGGKSQVIFVGPRGVSSDTVDWTKSKKGGGQSTISLHFDVPCADAPPEARGFSHCDSGSDAYDGPLALCQTVSGLAGDCKESSKYVLASQARPMSDAFSVRYEWATSESDVHRRPSLGFSGLNDSMASSSVTAYARRDVRPGRYHLYYASPSDSAHNATRSFVPVGVSFEVEGMGGVYVLYVSRNRSANAGGLEVLHTLHTVAAANSVSILWQVPQYLAITIAEVLFVVSGYEFTYAHVSRLRTERFLMGIVQSPASLKTVVQAIWLLTVALGDVIILLIAQIRINEPVTENFAYAAAMAVVITVFALLSVFYFKEHTYTKPVTTARSISEAPKVNPSKSTS
ncbi:Protein PEPT-2 [Aphelenchoides avenae]|nr:Protein PEPT-2 [Aphelenchus avenae]